MVILACLSSAAKAPAMDLAKGLKASLNPADDTRGLWSTSLGRGRSGYPTIVVVNILGFLGVFCCQPFCSDVHCSLAISLLWVSRISSLRCRYKLELAQNRLIALLPSQFKIRHKALA